MKNDDLSYNIRALLDTSDTSDPEWDPDKFWNLFEARKRRRQKWIMLSYSMAATVIFVVASIVLTGDGINRYIGTNSRVSSITQGKKTSSLLKNEIDKSLLTDSRTKTRHLGGETSIKKEISQPEHANIQSNKPTPEQVKVHIKKPSNLSIEGSYANDRYIEQRASILSGENDNMPSLFRMFEEAQKERELRNLSVQLEDRANYNRFWLTVNQHLLANKLNSDQLHYEQY